MKNLKIIIVLLKISTSLLLIACNSQPEQKKSVIRKDTLFYFADKSNMALGNPSGASVSTDSTNNYLMFKPQYCLSYNNTKHLPNWTSWHLQLSDIGSAERKNKFRKDSLLPTTWYHVTPANYSKSGFDKGHMCPSADRTSTAENNAATFLMTNMIPQSPKNNEITWEHLEEYSRKLVSAGNELYITSGPYGRGGVGKNGLSEHILHNVLVPARTWKIIVVTPTLPDNRSRIDTTTRVIAVIMPNDQTCADKQWYEYRVSVHQIEALTGYDFLSNVPKEIQKVIEEKVDTVSMKR